MNIATTQSPPRSVGSQLASRALEKMSADTVRTVQDQCRIGLHYNDRVTQESTDPNETLIARVSRQAYGRTQNVYSAYGVLKASFQHLDRGVTAPVSQSLAQVGQDAVFNKNVRTVQDQDRIGLVYTRAAGENGDASEKAVSETVLRAYDRVQNSYSALGVLSAGLSALSAGVPGPLGPALANVGLEAMYNKNIRTAQDQCRVGLVFTKAVGQYDESQAREADSTIELYNRTNDVYLALDHLKDFLKRVKTESKP